MLKKNMKRKYAYDYYEVEVPSDYSEHPQERFDTAVIEARENARFFSSPCEWRLIRDDGEIVKLCRKRFKMSARIYNLGPQTIENLKQLKLQI